MRVFGKAKCDGSRRNCGVEATLVHSLRNHLNVIASGMTLLSRHYNELLGMDGIAIVNSVKLSNLELNRVLADFFALNRAKRDIDFQDISLKAVVDSCIEELAPSMLEHNARISYETELPILCCDGSQIRDVFLNLFQNSLKYRRKGVSPEITIQSSSVTRDDGGSFHVIKVTDNGIGFETDEAPMLFEPFYRLSNPGVEGTGLGLSICRDIILQHNGRIDAEGTPGLGSRFTIELPCAPLAQLEKC